MNTPKNILITGAPKSGKSTLLQKLISSTPNKVGFVTPEIRENGERVGFAIETSHGEKVVLAHVNINSSYKVSRYGVDVPNFERAVQSVSDFDDANFLYIDEIGQMELFSDEFKNLVVKYLGSPNKCLATLTSVYEDEFITEIKNRDDVIIVEITPENREEQEKYIRGLLE